MPPLYPEEKIKEKIKEALSNENMLKRNECWNGIPKTALVWRVLSWIEDELPPGAGTRGLKVKIERVRKRMVEDGEIKVEVIQNTQAHRMLKK